MAINEQNNDIREQQRQLWNKFSPGWEKWDNFVIGWLRPIGDKLLEEASLMEGHLVLDVATGTGEPGLTAAQNIGNGKVIGTDLAEEMINIANKKADIKGVSNYTAHVADSSGLNFKNESFDSVICRFGIMYFPEPQDGVKEMARVLKKGGKISLSAWTGPQKNQWATAASAVINKMLNLPPPPANAPGVFRCSQAGTLTSFLKEAGLQNIEEKEITGEIYFDSPEHYWEFVNDVVAPVATALSKVDQETKERIKQEICQAVKSNEINGKILFTWSTWVASGTK